MNPIPPIFQAQRSETQNSTPASAAQPPQGGSRDFAATLSDTGSKPVRRHASHKQLRDSPNGNRLPSSGNQPPPPAIAPPAGTQTPPDAAQTKDTAGTAPVAQSGSAGADPKAKPAATAPADSAAAGSPAAAKAAADASSVQAGAALLAADPKAAASIESAAAAAATTVPAAPAPADGAPGPMIPDAASIRSLPTGGAATAGTGSMDQPVGAKPRDAARSDAAQAAAAFRPTAADGNSPVNDPGSSNGPTANADAAAQAVMAAVVAQTQSTPANGAATAANDAAASDGTVTPDGGSSLQGLAAANDAQLPAPAAGPHAPAAPSAIAAATAAAVVQAAQGAADAGAADRHSRGNGQTPPSASSADGTAGAAQLLTSNAPTDAAPVPTFKIPAGVDTADFGQGIADRVSLMMDGNLGLAKLQVNPPALGPIEVRIALQAGHAQVSFSSHSAVTRDALESSAPKLREMLGSQGFAQVSVDISHRSFQDRAPPSHAYETSAATGDSAAILPASAPASRTASGLLDAYA
jgi:flagellar hook-length control protein FliK